MILFLSHEAGRCLVSVPRCTLPAALVQHPQRTQNQLQVRTDETVHPDDYKSILPQMQTIQSTYLTHHWALIKYIFLLGKKWTCCYDIDNTHNTLPPREHNQLSNFNASK